MKMKLILSIVLLMALTACGKESKLIDNVKQRALTDTLTYQQGFEGTPYCQGSEWSVEQDEKMRDMVVHTCYITITKDHMQEFMKKKSPIAKYPEGVSFLNILKSKTSDAKSAIDGVNRKLEDIKRDKEYGHETLPLHLESSLDSLEHAVGTRDLDEAKAIYADLTTKLEADKEKLPLLVGEYVDLAVSNMPNEFTAKRVTRVVMLPNNNDQWIAPEFTITQNNFVFGTDVYSLPVHDITDKKFHGSDSIYVYILSKFVSFDDENESFEEFLFNKCDDRSCPLNSMVYFEG